MNLGGFLGGRKVTGLLYRLSFFFFVFWVTVRPLTEFNGLPLEVNIYKNFHKKIGPRDLTVKVQRLYEKRGVPYTKLDFFVS